MKLDRALQSFLPSLFLLGSTSAFRANLPRTGLAVRPAFSSQASIFYQAKGPLDQRLFSSTTDISDEEKQEKDTSKAPGHDVRGAAPMKIDPEELKIQQALAEHQKNAPKLGFPTDGKI